MQKASALWYRIIYTGTEEIKEDDLKLGITKGINLFCIWICIINLIGGPIFSIASGKLSVLLGSLLEILLLVSVVKLNHKKRRVPANLLFYLILLAATFYFSVILGPLAEAQLMIVLLVGFAFFLFTSRTIRILCTVISVLLLAVMEANFKFHLIQTKPVSTNVAYGMRWTSYFVIISLVALLFYLFDKNYERLLNKQTLISLKKSNLIRTAFHEIRSEFKGMKMILSVLASNEELLQTEGMSKVLGDLRNGSEKIEMVIGNLLNYSKGEAGIVEKPLYEPLNLKLILRNMADINQYFANKKGVRIVYQAAGEVPEYLISDRFKINQIFTNLLHNAIKFSKPHTVVRLALCREASTWKISITDEGVGISPEKLAHIFDPFVTERNKENTEGIGLGLHITQQLVAAMNGTIEVESKPGVGSSFTVRLPIIQSLSPNAFLREKELVLQ